MYEIAAREVGDLFAAHLSGNPLPLICVVSGAALSDQARGALENSARALGYGEGSCAFAVADAGEAQLDANSMQLIVEGLDPLCVIAADATGAKLLAEAYRCPVPLDSPSRIMGRPALAFESFDSMLGSSQDKQIAWALLKKLPRRSA